MYLVCYKGNNIFDRLIRIYTGKDITHVGLALDEPSNGTISYYANRYEKDSHIYTESLNDVDLYPIGNRSKIEVEPRISKIKSKYTLLGDIGIKPEVGRMSSYEYVARLLGLGCPDRYTLEDLIKFSQI